MSTDKKLFEGIPPARLRGLMLQGINLARLSAASKPFKAFDPDKMPVTFTPEEFARARAEVEAEDRALITNDKGEQVMVSFPAND